MDDCKILPFQRSAGGLAVYLHVDFIRSLIPAHIPLHGIADAGFFLNERNISGYEHYRIHMEEILKMQNASGQWVGQFNTQCANVHMQDRKL